MRKVTFHPKQHEMIKEIKPLMRQMVDTIVVHAEDANLSHFDIHKYREMGEIDF